MPDTATAVAPRKAWETGRTDGWWVGPAVTAAVLVSFLVYAHYRLFDGILWGSGNHGQLNWWHQTTLAQHGVHYLSPFFSPNFYDWFGLSAPIPYVSAALLILWAPAGFRTTCYYYRKAYYRSLFANPPACAVTSPWPWYKGERFLLVWQNLHRYMLYAALAILPILWWDAFLGTRFALTDATGAVLRDATGAVTGTRFGMGVGTLVLTGNALCLSLYTFSCHCWRHLIGGNMNCFATPGGTPTLRYRLWKRSTFLNERHMLFAWISLIWVGFTDVYVTLVARGVWTDVRLF
jgi:hypothetical protein